nr:chitobiase/beta-hexosaminidase C-terminal domain-containing protein [Cyclobacteriaceae bacterium]
YPVSDTLVTLTQIVLGTQQNGVSVVNYDFKPVAPDVLEKLNTPFCSVTQLYQNSPALQADFFVREFYQAESLQKLKAAKDQLVSLNLSKMPISDDDLTVVVEFKNLEKLNLNFTAVTGNGIKQLTKLSKLKSLTISGTAVTAESVRLLAGNSALTEVFVWNTPITAAEVAALSKDFPKIHFVHRLFTDNNILALGKPQLLNDGVLKQGETLVLRHSMPGVTIRYTLDDSAPDSLSGLTYKDPLRLIETVTLKAIACKDGWYCSNLLEAAVFVEGIKPDRVTLLTPPDKQYPGEGAASLTDRQKGLPDFFREPSWLGYRENPMEVLVEFADTPELSKIVLSYADNLGAYVFPPAAVELWGGSSEMNLKRIQAMTYEMPKSYRPNSMAALEIPFTPAAYSHYKIIVRPVSRLPEWHGGKGQKGWFFVDEVFFYN